MKKILLINTKYTEFGGENTNFEEEKNFFSNNYNVSFLEFQNTNYPKFIDSIGLILNTNFNSNKLFKKRLNEFNPDIIYIHNLWFKGNLGILKIANKHSSKKIIKVHNFRPICSENFSLKKHLRNFEICPMCSFKKESSFSIFNKYYKNSYIKSFILILHSKKFLNLIKKFNITIFALSNFQKQILINGGIKENSIKIFSNPSSSNLKNLHNYKSRIFTYAGKIDKSKGVEELVNTWVKLDLDNYYLYIIGTGPQLNYLKSKYNNKNIKYFGQLQNDEVIDLIMKSRAVVTATKLYEGQPKLLMEASSLGVPSIFPSYGGMGEFFPDEYSFKFIQNDYNSLKNTFKLSLNDETIKKQSQIVFNYYLNNFSTELQQEQFDKFIEL